VSEQYVGWAILLSCSIISCYSLQKSIFYGTLCHLPTNFPQSAAHLKAIAHCCVLCTCFVVGTQMKCNGWVGCCYCFLLSAYFYVLFQPSLTYINDPRLLVTGRHLHYQHLSGLQKDAYQLEGSETNIQLLVHWILAAPSVYHVLYCIFISVP
jgi:hypothetical protein